MTEHVHDARCDPKAMMGRIGARQAAPGYVAPGNPEKIAAMKAGLIKIGTKRHDSWTNQRPQ